MGTGKTVVVCVSVACLAWGSARSGAGADGDVMARRGAPNPGPVRLEDSFTAAAVRNAIDGAARRLRQPRCQELFTDFSDAQGRRLSENLAAQGGDGASYMEQMLFYDGHREGRCRHPHVVAYTQPGSRVVFVCGRAFETAYQRERRQAEAVLIHEALHSLGLGENPPSSAFITQSVLKKCSR